MKVILVAKTLSGKIGMFLIGIAPVMLIAGIANHVDAIITALAPTLTAIIGFWHLSKGQREIHLTMNSKLDQLVSTKEKAAHAEGKLEERQEARDRREKGIAPE